MKKSIFFNMNIRPWRFSYLFANFKAISELIFQLCLKPSLLERYPAFYHSAPCEKLKCFVRSRHFEYGVVLVLILNFVAVVIETTVCILLYLAVCLSLLFACSHLLPQYFSLILRTVPGRRSGKKSSFSLVSLSLYPSDLFTPPIVLEIFGCHVIFQSLA
jgi:hypothetical protein